MSEVTRILSAIEQGDPHAAEQLLPLVYGELRRLAAKRLSLEKPGQTLQATALVHEAYVRLVGEIEKQHWRGAALLRRGGRSDAPHPRRTGRRKGRVRHGGGRRRVDLLEAEVAVAPSDDEQILLLDEALTRLAAARPQAAELVQLRFFSGLTIDEAAPILGLSPRTARRLWSSPEPGCGAIWSSRPVSRPDRPIRPVFFFENLDRFLVPASHCLTKRHADTAFA